MLALNRQALRALSLALAGLIMTHLLERRIQNEASGILLPPSCNSAAVRLSQLHTALNNILHSAGEL